MANKRKFKCNGCGDDRPCFVETNQEIGPFEDMLIDYFKCILDETNQTSYNWVELNSDDDKNPN